MDVQSLATEFADLQFASLPVAADAVTIGLKAPGRRPRVIVNRKGSNRRRRFTLAHEIGHILSPWHTGTIVSHASFDTRYVDQVYDAVETEANQFAAELLVPTDWLSDAIAGAATLRELINRVPRAADVSPLVVAIRLTQVMTAGFVFVVTNSEGLVTHCGRSAGTAASLPPRGQPFLTEHLARLAGEVVALSEGASKFLLLRFDPPVADDALAGERRSAAVLLKAMLEETCADEAERAHLQQSLAGIFGHANTVLRGDSELVGHVIQRVASHAKFTRLAGHELFHTYLQMRARELTNAQR